MATLGNGERAQYPGYPPGLYEPWPLFWTRLVRSLRYHWLRLLRRVPEPSTRLDAALHNEIPQTLKALEKAMQERYE